MSTKQIKILLIFDGFSSMSQRVYLECLNLRHHVSRHQYTTAKAMIECVSTVQPDVIICPFLTKRIPEEIYTNKRVPCLIVHPGIEGDRGMSSIDWALSEDATQWGVTILQAEEVMDSGDIWDTNNFSTQRQLDHPPTKSRLYRQDCIEAAVAGLKNALAKFLSGAKPRPLDYSNPNVLGRLRPTMKQTDRAIDWSLSAGKICSLLRASDSQPGTLENLEGVNYFLFGAYVAGENEDDSNAAPKTLIGKRDGAVLIKCGEGAVFVSHLKLQTKPGEIPGIKLPATQVLPVDVVSTLKELAGHALQVPFMTMPATFQEMFTWERNDVCYLWFNFYNGAMSTDQCKRLAATVNKINEDSKAKILVLMGGLDFWSNGINLNTIEASDDPGEESWRNINAIDDFVKAIMHCRSKLTISAFLGNAGAGGVMAALAADRVWAHGGVVLNASYKRMHLYGSEYWTYNLPKRVGPKIALELTDSVEPISANYALSIGLVDNVLCPSYYGFVEQVVNDAEHLLQSSLLDSIMAEKRALLDSMNFEQLIGSHREKELEEMRACFASKEYEGARKAFVYKSLAYQCMKH